MYRVFFKLVLQHLDAERAHALAGRALRALRATPLGRAIVAGLVGRTDDRLQVHALGLTFPSPLGVAAGLDKDATWFDDLGALGFGFVEVGTVTTQPQEGNPRPRLARLTTDRALVNRMAFPNPGARVVADRLRRSGPTIVGVNISKPRDAAVEAAGDGCRVWAEELARFSDYVVINVSSPNTPGLRDMQAVDLLRPLVTEIRNELRTADVDAPILIKISADLEDHDLHAVAELAIDLELDGIVAVNTTVDRAGLSRRARDDVPFDGGGVSGAPLKARAVEVLRILYGDVGNRLVLISVGGIETAEDVWDRIAAGASLVQSYTGFIYGGPAWPRRVNRALARRTRSAGLSSVQDLVGSGHTYEH